ncbi:DUF72 domain-containing protein [Caldicellulosiruptor acetigenus]|uniref:DUF72 domain-containing protein n=1 Tax=Caldicellulosiruptor acetigenus TaxID=301953 RepID=UPI00041686B0|nr:DUF72 domain-containing protein [Caldicellulosiruptor acetigenus]WAM36361.1 DUF72 domain-containing protein [Caldicellulosiruptor acetigenus]
MGKKLYIGTSGWSYSHWKEIFYPVDLPYEKRLEFYSKHFATSEVNSSFYHLPQEKTIINWYNSTPEGFIFSVKASRIITHLKRLSDVDEEWENFIKRIDLLKEKLGPILLQFPPSFKKDEENLQRLISFLRGKEAYRFALEFRHKSWCDEEVYEILKSLHTAWVIADSSRYPKAKVITADFAYIRMHGPEALFSSCYSEEQLEELAKDIEEYLKICNEIYVYFNNDVNSCAVQNAKTLIEFTAHML